MIFKILLLALLVWSLILTALVIGIVIILTEKGLIPTDTRMKVDKHREQTAVKEKAKIGFVLR